MTEIYRLPQGSITVIHYDSNFSIGLLELNPNKKLPKHNRPADEELVQIFGTSTMKLFDGNNLVKEVVLKEGERLIIPANQFHVHSNPTNKKSITSWKFNGDIVNIIENIKQNFKQIL